MRIWKTSKAGIGIAILLLSAVLSIECNLQAETSNPERGSVQFGAKKNPVKNIERKMGRFADVFADVADKVVPSVVSVIPTRIDTVRFYRNPFYRFFEGQQGRGNDFFDFFFGPPNQQNAPEPETRERRQKGIGSGVIVSEQGYILTNYHVVAGASEIEVRLSDDRQFKADVVGTDSLSDVAVIKIRAPRDLPVIYIGDSDSLRRGDWVLAVGNPFSLTSTVTAGIVSAKGRRVMPASASYQNFIQTDAAINPGNSGGALVNIRGELIGINTMIYSQTGGFMGIGFAIPINMARRVMEDIIYEGRVIRGWVGVSIQELDQSTRRAIGLPKQLDGILVADVFDNQPADKAGVRRGDIILSISGQNVSNVNELRNVVAAIRPGKTVALVVFRDGEKIEKEITITEREPRKVARGGEPEAPQRPQSKTPPKSVESKTGIQVSRLTPELRSRFNIAQKIQGVVVLGVDPSVQDERQALTPGDVISQVKIEGSAWKTIASEKDFASIFNNAEAGEAVIMLIQRNGVTQYVSFEIPGAGVSMR